MRDGLGRAEVEQGGPDIELPLRGSTADAAYREFLFADLRGWMLCRELYGDAVLEWTYDGRAIVGVASRRDGDHAALYSWWRNNARFVTD